MAPQILTIQEYFNEGAQALESAYRPGHVVHLAIDWQRLYCDPLIPSNKHNDLRRAQEIFNTLHDTSDFADAVRVAVPTWWIYHDLALNEQDHFPENYFQGVDEDEKARRIAAIRAEGHQICGCVDPARDLVLRKPFKNAFESTDLHERLQRNEIDTLLISGLYRHYAYKQDRAECVGQTMKAAADKGYKTFVVEDLTVDKVTHNERTQQALLHMTRSEEAYSVTAQQAHRIIASRVP